MEFNIIVGLQHGDEGKGKVSKILSKEHEYCLRFNGGPNAGHTVYVKDQKVHLKQIPVGIFEGKISIIGGGCLVDLKTFKSELDMLVNMYGVDILDKIKVCYNAHLISEEAINHDILNDVVGSTKSGIGYTYSQKSLRYNKRVCDMFNADIYGCEIVDLYNIFEDKNAKVICEGAQGFELDIDLGDYPYVTSSNCTVGQLICNGIPPQSVNKVYGICKIYDTYVGNKSFHNDKFKQVLDKLQEIGEEFGTVTSRARQCNWLDLDKLRRAIKCNGVTNLIINKCDIICELEKFVLIDNNDYVHFGDFNDMKNYITSKLHNLGYIKEIVFSGSKYTL
jgi:adenylosuccinate synthase